MSFKTGRLYVAVPVKRGDRLFVDRGTGLISERGVLEALEDAEAFTEVAVSYPSESEVQLREGKKLVYVYEGKVVAGG